MAEPITREQVEALPVHKYEDIRGQLKTGDLLFASGGYPVSRLIRHLSKSPWSHVGIIYVLPEIQRVFLLESVEDMGVRFAPVSKYLGDNYWKGKPYDGPIVIASVAGIEPEHVVKLGQHGMDLLTYPYDWWEGFRILRRYVLGKLKRHEDRAYLCSELVNECFDKAERGLRYNDDGYSSPNDIWLDSQVSLRWRIK